MLSKHLFNTTNHLYKPIKLEFVLSIPLQA